MLRVQGWDVSLVLFVFLSALPCAAPAQQDYPSRPIRLLVPAAPGGTTDILARLVGAKLGEALKQQVIVDNRASASGVIAGEMAANAAPDGYTLLLAYHQHTVNAALNPKLPYHPVNSFTPITQLTSAGLMLVVHPSTPVETLAQFVEWTRNFKGALNFGSAGIGSGGHLAGELYNQMAGVKAAHVPYKGSGPALADLVGGQYHYNFAGIQAAQTLVRAGKLRALAVTTPKARRRAARPARGGRSAAGFRGRRVVRDHRAGKASRADPRAAARRDRQDPAPARHPRAHSFGWVRTRRQLAGGVQPVLARRPRQVGEGRQGERGQGKLTAPGVIPAPPSPAPPPGGG